MCCLCTQTQMVKLLAAEFVQLTDTICKDWHPALLPYHVVEIYADGSLKIRAGNKAIWPKYQPAIRARLVAVFYE